MDKNRPEVCILGTFHMRNNEALLSARRQNEMLEVISKISSFKPTKIAVEMEVDQHKLLNQKYKQFLSGNFRLELSEVYQIGFRAAFESELKEIHPIDWMGTPSASFGDIQKWLQEQQPALYSELFDNFSVPPLTNEKSVLDYYKELNESSWLDYLHSFYVNTARIGDFNHYVGIEWLSWWYKRNLIIFSNLTRLIESQNERILLIIGCSHNAIINKFLKESGTCEVVDPLILLA
ncbi:DUF5694 domain-containing protein [Gracilibacillus caseinilyticus]|uniref:DUF5694 domain-containing protein n=1 Tax=Gracilibacillus caseinilyticus TaxID=2932256 RepID=A0ABY4EX57_9BACI|nr:DUF5694 domain-containing protein [Gracilibacillus caseinilyticus]UOQ48998.1 DUF5694 domain-containing protein [Gracilibacillus caseinilyticus]